MDLGVLEPGRFSTPDAGRTVFHAERVDGEQIHDVFLQREIDGRVTVILAERGQRVHDETSGMLSFVLYDGRRYEGTPGELDYTIVEFSEHGIPIRDRRTEELVESPEMKRTSELLSSTARLDQTELQWRLSAPLSLFVLALLAVPLSHSRPREGRYARLGAGLLVYLIYANSLSMARIWVERGGVPLWFGMWWVHVGLGLLAVVLFARDSGWLIWRARSTSIRRIGA
jgi:lipopolysaccharide export system permease protein